MDPHANDESLLPVYRALVEAHTVASRVADRHSEALGLTPSQFDVVATLGDTEGMTCKELGELTLITKGTLNPVLDRLEQKGLVSRTKGQKDARQTLVALTEEGDKVYRATFMRHVDYLRGYIDRLVPEEQAALVALLNKLKSAFTEPR